MGFNLGFKGLNSLATLFYLLSYWTCLATGFISELQHLRKYGSVSWDDKWNGGYIVWYINHYKAEFKYKRLLK